MSLHFAPIPTPDEKLDDPLHFLRHTQEMWKPYLGKISRRSKESVDVIIDKVRKGNLQLAMVVDDENKCHAVLGFQYRREGDDLVAEIVHLTGTGMKKWDHLMPEMHAYLKEFVGCKSVRAYCRRGLEPFLEKEGYKRTHVIMEHRL